MYKSLPPLPPPLTVTSGSIVSTRVCDLRKTDKTVTDDANFQFGGYCTMLVAALAVQAQRSDHKYNKTCNKT